MHTLQVCPLLTHTIGFLAARAAAATCIPPFSCT